MYRRVELQCPGCGAKLVRYDQRDKWSCKTCNGVLVGIEELAVELGALGPSLADPTIHHPPSAWQTKPCARCRADMRPIHLGPLTLDRCDADQLLWFDRGELGRVRGDFTASTEPWVERLIIATGPLDDEDDEDPDDLDGDEDDEDDEDDDEDHLDDDVPEDEEEEEAP